MRQHQTTKCSDPPTPPILAATYVLTIQRYWHKIIRAATLDPYYTPVLATILQGHLVLSQHFLPVVPEQNVSRHEEGY